MNTKDLERHSNEIVTEILNDLKWRDGIGNELKDIEEWLYEDMKEELSAIVIKHLLLIFFLKS